MSAGKWLHLTGDTGTSSRSLKLKISVSILCYNYGRFLTQAIESVLSQELPNGATLDVLVVDDGSTDETESVCAQYSSKIRSVRSANQGFASSLTKGLSLAEGGLVFFLDADDFFAPGKIALVLATMGSETLYIDHSQYFVDEGGLRLPGVHGGGNTSTICVRREAALPLLPVENEVAFHSLLFAGRGKRMTAPLTFYRVHGSSMTNRLDPGVQNEYLAGVHQRLVQRTRSTDFAPNWMLNGRQRVRVAKRYELLYLYNKLEASLERGERLAALRFQLLLVSALIRSPSQLSYFHLKMIVKTLLFRPSFRRG